MPTQGQDGPPQSHMEIHRLAWLNRRRKWKETMCLTIFQNASLCLSLVHPRLNASQVIAGKIFGQLSKDRRNWPGVKQNVCNDRERSGKVSSVDLREREGRGGQGTVCLQGWEWQCLGNSSFAKFWVVNIFLLVVFREDFNLRLSCKEVYYYRTKSNSLQSLCPKSWRLLQASNLLLVNCRNKMGGNLACGL